MALPDYAGDYCRDLKNAADLNGENYTFFHPLRAVLELAPVHLDDVAGIR